MPTAPFMCLDGEIVPYAEAKIHAFTAVVKYGCGVFEGIRAYWSEARRELFVFRLPEHLERLRFGMKLMRFAQIYPSAYLADCVLRMLRANDLRENAHIRLIAYLGGDDELAQTTGPVGLIAGAVPRGSPKGVAGGIHVRVGSWSRIADNALPPRVKCTGNYVNNRAAEIDARQDGYDGVIMLTAGGKVSEGSGACVFIARGGRLHTPDLASDILESITRHTDHRDRAGNGRAARGRAHRRPLRALCVRGGVLVRFRPGDRAHPLGRPHPGRRRSGRPDHTRAAGALFSDRAGRERRAPGLADPGVGDPAETPIAGSPWRASGNASEPCTLGPSRRQSEAQGDRRRPPRPVPSQQGGAPCVIARL